MEGLLGTGKELSGFVPITFSVWTKPFVLNEKYC